MSSRNGVWKCSATRRAARAEASGGLEPRTTWGGGPCQRRAHRFTSAANANESRIRRGEAPLGCPARSHRNRMSSTYCRISFPLWGSGRRNCKSVPPRPCGRAARIVTECPRRTRCCPMATCWASPTADGRAASWQIHQMFTPTSRRGCDAPSAHHGADWSVQFGASLGIHSSVIRRRVTAPSYPSVGAGCSTMQQGCRPCNCRVTGSSRPCRPAPCRRQSGR